MATRPRQADMCLLVWCTTTAAAPVLNIHHIGAVDGALRKRQIEEMFSVATALAIKIAEAYVMVWRVEADRRG